MNLLFHEQFVKQLKRLYPRQRQHVEERLALFLDDPWRPLLSNHALMGHYRGYRSINIGGDLRAVYKLINEHACIFVALGTHSQLYA